MVLYRGECPGPGSSCHDEVTDDLSCPSNPEATFENLDTSRSHHSGMTDDLLAHNFGWF